MLDEKSYRPGETVYCTGENCKDKRCEVCPAKKSKQFDVSDTFRSNKEAFPNGYYSSGGIARVKSVDKDGNIITKYVYARPHGD